MSQLDRFDVQSDQKIMNKTSRAQSPDNDKYIRLTITMPWGEERVADVDQWTFNTASQWCAMIRREVDARYDNETLAEESRARRSQGSAGGDAPAPAAGDREAAEAAPQANLEDAAPRSEGFDKQLESVTGRLDEIEGELLRLDVKQQMLEEEREGLRKKASALAAALKAFEEAMYGGSDDDAPCAGVPESPEGGEEGDVGGDDAAPPRPSPVF